MKHIVAYRFSAMGDVLNTLPVFHSLLKAYPDIKITFITKKNFCEYFNYIDSLDCIGVDFNSEYKGINGLNSLVQQIVNMKPDVIIDLHQVLRTFYLNFRLKRQGYAVFHVDKHRKQKKHILKTKQIQQLPHITQIYREPFINAGLDFNIDSFHILKPPKISNKVTSILNVNNDHIIGIAPFAKHAQKEWGLHNIIEFITHINIINTDIHFLLFGGGPREIQIMDILEKKFNNVSYYTGKLSKIEEVELISQLDAMLSMDSANMHLASLTGIPTFSIWGPTHPCFGYAPIEQPENYIFKIPNGTLDCHPCSVYGNKKCHYSELKCMKMIDPVIIASRILDILKNKKA